MNNDQIQLSICILAYNQPEEVERLLSSLVGQIASGIEVLIRDDSTNQDTHLIVEKFNVHYPIRYFHGKKEGIDKTVIFLVEQAKGKFVWWLGDDEVLSGAVAQVLSVIEKNPKLTFIWANYHLVNESKLAIDFSENREFVDRNELLESGGAGLGFISATIFSRRLALEAIPEAAKYVGSLFANLYLVLTVISKPGSYYYLRGPIVCCHPTTNAEIKEIVTNKGRASIVNRGFEVYGITFPAIVNEFRSAFTKSAIRKTISKSFGQTWRGMLVGWIGGWDTPENKRVLMIKNYWSYPECWIASVLFLMPLAINKALYRVYKKLIKRR